MSWIQMWQDETRDRETYGRAMDTHNYFVWDIYYESQMESINKQINELNREIQQVNSMSLTATAAISPYQTAVNTFSASNDLLTLCMAQKMNNIIKNYSDAMQTNSTEIKEIQKTLKKVEDRKRSLMRSNRDLIQHKETWQQSQLSQQLLNQHQSFNNGNNNNHQNLNNNQQSDLQQNVENMQNKINQMQNMMINLQTHLMEDDDDDNKREESKSDNEETPETAEFYEWLENVVKLPQYFDVFIKNGFEDLESICDITKDELTQINITKLGHQKKIIREIQKLNN